MLSRNEVARDYAYNRRVFLRVRTGWYQFNPALAVRRKTPEGEQWLPLFTALNLPVIRELSEPFFWDRIDSLLGEAGLEVGEPIITAALDRLKRQRTR